MRLCRLGITIDKIYKNLVYLYQSDFHKYYKRGCPFLILKRGSCLTLKEIVVTGEAALKIADALTSTSLRILQLVSQKRLDVSTIARKLDLSEAYMSEQVRMLEEAKLIEVSYERGKRGIRKLCELAVSRIIIVIKPD